jgi:hypothetical protein
LEALDAALEPTLPQPETPPAGEPDGDEDAAAAASAELPEGGEEAEGEQPAGDEGDESAERNPDGTFKAKAKKDEAELGPDGKPKAKEELGPDGKPIVKKADPLNDPIDAKNTRTKERIESLVSMVKERDAQIAKADQLLATIEETGMSPDEFGTMLTYSRLAHSTKPEDQEAAFTFLQSEYRAACIRLGKTDQVDLLSEHEDLKTAVETGGMTEKHANELALARTRAAETERANTQRTTVQSAEAEYAQSVAAAKNELNTLEVTLRKDPQYQAKYDHLVPLARPVFAGIHPSKWAATFKTMWDGLKLAPPTTPTPAPAGAPAAGGPAPLRPNRQPAGQGQKQPGSALEALDAALANM